MGLVPQSEEGQESWTQGMGSPIVEEIGIRAH